MSSLRWYRCSNIYCSCHKANPAYLRGSAFDIEQLANEAFIDSAFELFGPTPDLSSREEIELIGVIGRLLSEAAVNQLVRVCPWVVARETLTRFRVIHLKQSPERNDETPEDRAA